MIDQVQFLLEQYPMLQHLVAIMVICRIIFKPLFAILGKYVELTLEEDDDKKLHKIMKSKAYKMTAFIVDMLASVKLPKIKRK
jgi:hypothetical protein